MTQIEPALWEEFDEADVVDVVVDIDAPDLQPTYTYAVPAHLRDALPVGTCIHVPFGGQDRTGYVVERRRLSASDPLSRRLREVVAPIEDAVTFNAEQARLAQWIAERYVCDLPDAIKCIAPAAMSTHVTTIVRLAEPHLTGRDAGDAMVQAHILETLRTLGGEADLEKLRDAASVSAFNGSYAGLVKKRLVVE